VCQVVRRLKQYFSSLLSLLSNNYYSFFDASGAAYVGNNYEFVGDNPLIVVTKDLSDYYHQYLTLSGF
jgi:hypothetical protein